MIERYLLLVNGKGGFLSKENTMEDVLSLKNNMKPLCNNAEVIKNLNETKQYTLMATGLLESVITDSNLTSAAAKLWEYLYSKAIMNENFCIRIKYKDLAEKFNRAERTIKRYVQDLKENEYLHIESNFYNHGQRANTFYLTIPDRVLKNLQSLKDRKKFSKENEVSTNHLSIKTNASSINETPLLTQDTNLIEIRSHMDNIVTPDHDINVTQYNNINKDILLNNNIVVVPTKEFLKTQTITNQTPKQDDENFVLRGTFEEIKDKDNSTDQEKINNIEKKVNILYKEMGLTTGEERLVIFNNIRELQTHISAITLRMNKRNHLAKIEISPSNTIEKSQHFDPMIDFTQMIGERKLSARDIERLEKSLAKLVFPSEQQKICNEIVYAIRFGALKNAQGGGYLNIPHAISIAIKLIREKRWETPVSTKRAEKTKCYLQKDRTKYFEKQSFNGYQHIGNLLQGISQTC